MKLLIVLMFFCLSSCSDDSDPSGNLTGNSDSISIEGHTIAFVDQGPRDGEPILLTHGIPTSSELYRDVIPHLVSKGYRVIANDFVGYGNSSKPERITLEEQAKLLINLMDTLGIETWNHVSHDLGGLITWELLGIDDSRIKKLVILNTTAYFDGLTPPEFMLTLAGEEGESFAESLANPETGKVLIGEIMDSGTSRSFNDIDDIELFWKPFETGTATYLLQEARALFGGVLQERLPIYSDTLKRLNVPAVVIWGSQDPFISFDVVPQFFAEDLGIGADGIIGFDDASHFIQEDQPAKLAESIDNFIKR
ncbi:MAG: alpha/beta fold hydrolase [Pseudobacteriovorax sp.]|nr:alpha/beta fold hydrolase [Pseudobacteriovorax sp.]